MRMRWRPRITAFRVLHVRTRADARTVIEGPIQVFCQATGSLVQPSKSQGLEVCAPDGGPPFGEPWRKLPKRTT